MTTNPRNPVEILYSDYIPRLSRPCPTCEDCSKASDLGPKCRACYRQWSRILWQDLPRELSRVTDVCKQLRGCAPETRKRIAGICLGKHTSGTPVRGTDAELVAAVKRVLAGPYGGNMEIALAGHWNTATEDAGKPKKRYQDAE